MTRGDKFIQELTSKGWDEEHLRIFVETGDCGGIALACSNCPFIGRDCPIKDVSEDVIKYFKEEIKEETEMKSSEIADLPPIRRNTIAEMREVVDAIEAGKPIQYKCVSDGETGIWQDTIEVSPNFHFNVYRVKPEATKKLRPFKNVDEFIKEAGGFGVIWLKRKIDKQMMLVTALGGKGSTKPIFISSWVNFNVLLADYTFASGRPCGVEDDA